MHLIALIIVYSAAAPGIAEVAIDSSAEFVDIGGRLEVLEDPKKRFKIETVSSGAAGRFARGTGSTPNHGFTTSAFWYRIQLRTDREPGQRVYLEMPYVVLDRLDVYISSTKDPRGFVHHRMGDTLAGGGRVIDLTDYVIPVDLAPGTPTVVYLRAETDGSLQLPLKLWQTDAFFGAISARQMFYGPIYGLLIVLLIYNLFLFIIFREASYGYLSLCVAGAFLYLGFFTGLAQAEFFASVPWLANHGYPFAMLSVHLPMWLFTRRFLELPRRQPWVDRAFTLLALVSALTVPVHLIVGSYRLTLFMVIGVVIPGVMLSTLSGVRSVIQGNRSARYYVLGWSLFFIGIIVFAVEKTGLLPRSLLTDNIHVLGYVATLLVLPLGLADRINVLRRERSEAQGHALQVQADAAAKLEEEVARKTADLQVANEQLGERNEQLQREMTQREATEAERAALERSLFQSQKMDAIGRLAGGVAHDMNNILAVISLTAQGIKADLAEQSDAQAPLDDVLAAAKRGGELAKNLLGFARRGRYQKERLSLNKSIEEIHRLLRRTIHQGVGIRLELAADLPEIEADPNQIGQILVNLAVNAAHAMSDKGLLTIRTLTRELEGADADGLAPGHYVVLEVADTGAGMSEEVKAQVFEPFFTTKAPGDGTGLGLSMVYGAVEAHGGRVTIDSAVGEGTTFQILLPALEQLARAPEVAQVARRDPTPETPAGAVLMVDDEMMLRRSTGRLLKRLGYQVFEAENGERALEVYEEERERIVVVLLDLVMPVMDGPEAFRQLRRLNPDLQVILVSGFSEEGDAEELLQAGAVAFLQKPYDLGDLKAALERAVA